VPQPPQFRTSFAWLTHRPPQQLSKHPHSASVVQPPPVPEELVLVELLLVVVVLVAMTVVVERPPSPPCPPSLSSVRAPHAAATSAPAANMPAQFAARAATRRLSTLVVLEARRLAA
jgi:hypothetical protein